MIHSLRHLLAVAILAIAGMACATAVASAQTCVIINGVKVYIDSNTVIVSGVTGGYGLTFQNPVPPIGPLNEFFTVNSIQINGSHPTLGAISIILDPSKPSSLSSLISNTPPVRFPATGTIRFFATATFSSFPGVTYESLTELEFENTNLTQIFPFGNASFSLKNPVGFLPVGTPGGVIGLNPPTYITLP